MGEWQPIETAPRNKTVVLIFQPRGQWKGARWWEAVICTAYWHQPANPEMEGHWVPKLRATHWMPLPDPPSSPEADQEPT